jgi:Phage Terminase
MYCLLCFLVALEMTKPTIAQLRKLQASPAAFRSVLLIDSDSGPQRLSDVCDDWQAADFTALDPGWRAVVGHKVEKPTLRAWLERPRGHSKTSDQAVQIAWALFASSRKLSGVCAAADRDQARLIRNAVMKLVQLNPWLKTYVAVQDMRIVNPHTDSTCDVLASDVASSYGLLCDFIICDEVTHWADRDLWDSLLSTAAKRKNCLLLVITNAGFCDSWQWTLREAIRTDPAWYFCRLDGPKASWITPERLDEQRRLLPYIAFARLWLNEWGAGSGDALHADDLTAALTMRGPMPKAEQGFAYVAGLDLSVRKDATALVTLAVSVGWDEIVERPQPKRSMINRLLLDAGLVEPAPQQEPTETIHHAGTNRIRLADLRVWEPSNGSRVDLSDVEAAIIDAHERYELSAVAVDPFQAELLVQRLQRRGIPIYTLDQTGITLQAQASAVLDGFRERIIDLYPQDQLLADLKGLRVAARNYGFRLISPHATGTETHATQHGDTATGFSLAMLAAKRVALRPSRTIQGRLVCSPCAA